jgi:predicted dehydrogenase
VAAVCDKRPGQLAAKVIAINLEAGGRPFDIRQCRAYNDFDEMLGKEPLDAVVTALPTDLHAEVAIRAMDRGLHVFSEKPMALTAAQCDAMIAARDRNKVQLQVGQCLRFWPEYRALLKAIRDQPYGRLRSLSLTRVGGYGDWGSEDWFNDHRRSGGAILDLHLHDVDWVFHAMGRPRALTAAGLRGKSGGIDDVTALWKYDDCTVTLRGSWMDQSFTMAFQSFFENASMEFGVHTDPALRVRRAGRAQDEKVPLVGGSAYANELRHFFECVRGEHPNSVCPAESTRESVRLVEEERRAIETGAWVELR